MPSTPSAEERAPTLSLPDVAGKPPFHLWHLPTGGVPWVTVVTIAVSAVATLLSFAEKESAFAIFYAHGSDLWLHWKWHALIASVFLHDGPLHLIFNCYWLWIFGRMLEIRLGRWGFLLLFLATAWVSAVAELAWAGNPGIGLSGAVYGIFGFLWSGRKRNAEFSLVATNNVIGLFCGWLLFCLLLTEMNVKAVANAAHVAGLLAGRLIGWGWVGSRWRTLAWAGVVALTVASFVPLLWAPWQDGWLAAKAVRAMERRDYNAALQWCAKIVPGSSYGEWARKMEANVHQYRARTTKQRAELLKIAEGSRDPNVLNSVAWQLATSPHEDVRDGAKAVTHATQACEIDGWKNPALLDTLAAAQAETGNFKEAEKWMLRALENPGEHAAILKKHLEVFRAGKPWREP